ncbi:hypothetical protein LTR85_007850 [Meristemomyces frigidus]|nr:hypothetical protein LTR85_007850 [Meristemomyces frigidus]
MLARGPCVKAGVQCGYTLGHDLLPFLYCTKTIQQRTYTQVSRGTTYSRKRDDSRVRRPERLPLGADPFDRSDLQQHHRKEAARNTAWRQLDVGEDRRAADRPQETWRNRRDDSARVSDHVPFENLGHHPEVEVDLEGSTITPNERKAFEKLFSMKKENRDAVQRQDENDGEVITKKRKPERELGLDAILDAAMANIKPRERPPAQFPDALRPMAEEARERQRTARTTRVDRQEAEKETAITQDLARITSLLDKAATDAALWTVLEKHVFDRVVATNIDPATTPKQRAALQAWQQTRSELESLVTPAVGPARREEHELPTLTANLPAHLLHFMQVAQSSFPASLLSLNLLPTLKSLGPSAFALGATPALYNAHMRALYAKHGPYSLHSIAETLREMDREVYDFDEETLAIILLAIKDARRFRRGHGGPALQFVWKATGVSSGVKGLLGWRHVVEEKRQEVALRKAREEEAMREAGVEVEDGEEDEESRAAVASGYALSYQNSEVSELRAFVKAQAGDDPPSDKPKEHYVRKLQKLDHRARFRFFDLAPKLRKLIYRELLVRNHTDLPRSSTCLLPQLLATCKLAHGEATSILYTENAPEEILLTAEYRGTYFTCSAVVGKSLKREMADSACLEYVGWPAHLRRFERVAIVIGVATVPGAGKKELTLAAKCINILLYSLVSDLKGSEKLEALDLRVQGALGDIIDGRDALHVRVLWPLTKLDGRTIAITIDGAPAAVPKQLLTQGETVGSSVRPGTLIERYWQLEEMVKRYYGVQRKTSCSWAPVTAVGVAAQQLEDRRWVTSILILTRSGRASWRR